MQTVPNSLWRHGNERELSLRIGVISSLFLQIVLTIYGNRRKYWRKTTMSIVVHLNAYMLANSLATSSLGILFRKDPKDKSLQTNYAMTALWAPILLVHRGGPDTITGYSLLDNELWLRYSLGLIGHFLMAGYIIRKSWDTSPLNFIAFPVFAAALVKCGERIWALKSASREQFRDLVLPDPDPGPNYAKFMDEYCSKRREGHEVSVRTVPEEASAVLFPWPLPLQLPKEVTDNIQDAQVVCDAHYVFNVFKSIFAEFIGILSIQDQDNSLDYFTKKLWGQACEVSCLQDDDGRKLFQARTAFRIIAVELGFMYDFLHTKANLFYSYWPWSAIFRVVSILSTVSAFIAFYIIDKHKYFRIEVLITYVLLAAAIALELYAVIVLLSSDWAMLWICRHKRMGLLIHKFISFLRWWRFVPANKRWSNNMFQSNLISICVREKPARRALFGKKADNDEPHETRSINGESEFARETVLKLPYLNVSDRLKLRIYDRLEEEARTNSGKKKVWIHWGDQALEDMKNPKSVPFDQRILLLHIATTLCYYNPDYDQINKGISESARVMSMQLSDYMIYLLLWSSFMLPNGIGLIRYRDTRAEAFVFLEERKKWIRESGETRVEAACKMLLAVDTKIEPSEVKGDQSKSVLFDACRLAKSLRDPETRTYKWDIICRAWVEMLAYAASRCTWNNHAQKLTAGGELLTHVWLLMAHLGITDHFQTSEAEDYATVKLEAN